MGHDLVVDQGTRHRADQRHTGIGAAWTNQVGARGRHELVWPTANHARAKLNHNYDRGLSQRSGYQ